MKSVSIFKNFNEVLEDKPIPLILDDIRTGKYKNAIIYLRKSLAENKQEAYEKAKAIHPEMPHYVVSETEVKVPAGWLIEQAGFKGKRFGDAGVHKNQALVLVNYGTATGAEIVALSRNIQQTILEKFGIAIEAEVNII